MYNVKVYGAIFNNLWWEKKTKTEGENYKKVLEVK